MNKKMRLFAAGLVIIILVWIIYLLIPGDLDSKDYISGFHKIKKKNSYLVIKEKNKQITLRGRMLPGMINKGNNILKLKPGLKGRYYLDFFYLLKSKTNQKITAALSITKGDDHKNKQEISLPVRKLIFRQQITAGLEKGDILTFNIKGADFGFISDPLFIKARQKTKGGKQDLIFIIVADTLRKDYVGARYNNRSATKNIQKFSQDAVAFSNAYSTSSWTLSAHMSMFTGLFPHKHNVNYPGQRIAVNIPLLTRFLHQEFTTYSFNGDSYISQVYGFNRGFDYYEEKDLEAYIRDASRQMFDSVRNFLDIDKSKKSFYFLHTYQIHNPYLPEIELADEYYGDSSYAYEFNPIKYINNGRNLYKIPAQGELEKIKKIYNAGVYTFDKRFGDFLAYLKSRRIYKDSMIVLLSDHGEEFFDHGAWEHGHSLYNELIQIPLFIKFPQNKYRGKEIKELVSIVDVLPTILDYYKKSAQIPQGIDGISLLDIIKGKKVPDRVLISYLGNNVLARGISKKISLIYKNLKFIYNAKPAKELKDFIKNRPRHVTYQIFDLHRDPAEKVNIFKTVRAEERGFFLKIFRKLRFIKGKSVNPEEIRKNLKSLGYISD